MKIDANKIKDIAIEGGIGIIAAAVAHAIRNGDLKLPEGFATKTLSLCKDVVDANVDNAIETSAE